MLVYKFEEHLIIAEKIAKKVSSQVPRGEFTLKCVINYSIYAGCAVACRMQLWSLVFMWCPVMQRRVETRALESANPTKTTVTSPKLTLIWKKRSEETQKLCTGCSKVEPNIFALPQTPFPGAQDGQNLISWRWSLPLPTNPVWRGSMHAISNYHGNRPTNTPTHPPTDRTDYNTLLHS